MKTIGDYLRLYKDRPEKFTAEDVGFTERTTDAMPCCGCFNWFYSPAMSKSVCQIFRPEDDGDVPSLGSCIFYTLDNTVFPKLEE